MKRGKNICNTLKAVRQQIADSNDIAYTPTECHHEGECAGTCPKCEQEMRYLEQQLDLRRAMGKAVSLVGISVGLAALTSCKTHKTNTDNEPLGGDVIIEERTEGIVPMHTGEKEDVDSLDNCKLAPIATVTDSTTREERIFGEIEETMPSFRGGQTALMEYLSKQTVVPASVKDKCRAIVSFTIERNGEIINAMISKSSGNKDADAEALRVVNGMPKWYPGKIKGQSVQVKYTLPVTFNPVGDSSQP